MQRTLEYLREIGAVFVKTEYYHHYARRRMDIWSADVMALHGRQLMAIQVTDVDHYAEHVTAAIATDSKARNWLRGGVSFYIYAWGKYGARGKRKLWRVKITQLVLNDDGTIEKLTHGYEINNTGDRP
jgi:hypothetical protein